MLIASADDIPFDPFNPFPQGGGNVYCPTAWSHYAYPNIEGYGNPFGGQEYGECTIGGSTGNFTDFNDINLDYGMSTYYATTQFNHSGPYGFIPTYDNITITKVRAFIIAPTHLKEGWFSVKLSSTIFQTTAPWLLSTYYYGSAGNAGVNTSYWYNSTLYPYKISNAFVPFPSNSWDITGLTNWTRDILISPNTVVMWTTIENATSPYSEDYIDYLGLWWEYYADFNYTGTDGNLIPSFTDNFNSILWLLIVFAPALALQYMFPKIGYAFGMFLMLFIFGLTQNNFMYVTIIGISALGIMLYKGD
jgi:hypothetical protein